MNVTDNIIETEDIILKSLLYDKEYINSIINYLKDEYFEEELDKRLFNVINKFFRKYNKAPNKMVLTIFFNEKDKTLNEDGIVNMLERINYLDGLKNEQYTQEWLKDETEEWVKRRALYNSIIQSMDYMESNSEKINSIPDVISGALKISFDNSIGHDYYEDYEKQLEYYHSDEQRYATNIDMLNKSLGGGFARKTLSVILGPPGGGKSRMMVDLASHYVRDGLDVLYITMELEEKVVRNRFDANMMDIAINDFNKIDKTLFNAKVNNLKAKTHGKLIIKEFPSAYANVHHFDNLMDDIKLKKEITPDVVVIDYMGEMMSLRDSGDNMYLRGRHIASELRGFCMKQNVIGITGWQLGKGGWNVSDVEMGNIAESAGVVHVVDYMGAIAGTDELKEENKFLWITLKNRLNKLNNYRKVMIGYDDDKMRHYDVEDYDSDESSKPITSPSGGGDKEKKKMKKFIFD